MTPTSANPQTETWYTQSVESTSQKLDTDLAHGLTISQVQQRLAQYGANLLAEKPKEPGWRAFLRQYKELMQIILAVTGVISLVMLGDIKTFILLFGLTIFNAILSMSQEAKAAASLASLQQALKLQTRVRRDGQVTIVEADQIVPGDIVLFEAGDKVAADGRLVEAATLEIEEAALTGESTPTLKNVSPIAQSPVALGDRSNMAYMNTTVTRGRGVMVVTATGMATEIGHIAAMMNAVAEEKTPLQKQLDKLTLILAGLAGLAFLVMVVIGLTNGSDLNDLIVSGVAMAVAAVPTGLPAIVTTVLALGTAGLVKQNAIVKRLPSVETLGSTSAICSDKTGTLTLNQMTTRELIVAGHRFTVEGQGYSTQGAIRLIGEQGDVNIKPAFIAMALDTDAVLDGDKLVGDPTEGALIVVAEKGGVDVKATREEFPRVAELPFDSAYKMMATFHNMHDRFDQPVVRAYVKGAPDVLLARSCQAVKPNGDLIIMDDNLRQRTIAENDRLASQGMRVLAFAGKHFDPATFNPAADLLDELDDLTLFALVGIVDPPRPEARVAIAECRSAGIQVRMITGDHAVTAAAIAKELGIPGRAITGHEFAAMSDEQLMREVDDIGVVARVAPEDKVRLVDILQRKGHIVAMTGDGVNDAPALKKADIGVAMGITGTEATKEAAAMILTDDNFATIVRAVDFGRALYDNLFKYIRFQLSTLVGYILVYLGAAIFNIAQGVPFSPGQVLWINFAVDALPSSALSQDKATPGLMARPPRPANAPVIDRLTWVWLTLGGIVMAVPTLMFMYYLQNIGASQTYVRTVGYAVFSLSHVFAVLSYRNPRLTVFSLESFNNKFLNITLGITLLTTLMGTELGLLQRAFDMTPLSFNQWMACLIVASPVLWVSELYKLATRSRVVS